MVDQRTKTIVKLEGGQKAQIRRYGRMTALA